MTSPARTFLHAALGALAVLCLALPPQPAQAQSTGTRVTVSFGAHTLLGQPVPEGTAFDCLGTPTCTNSIVITIPPVPGACTNSLSYTLRWTMTGLNLGSSGPIQGSIVYGNIIPEFDFRADGTCAIIGSSDLSYPYTGSWNAGTGTGTLSIGRPTCSICSQFPDNPFTGTIRTESVPPPVFPMVVRTNITATSATASADIQFRPEDVGSSGSVFVFALAPRDIVKSAADGSEPFVVGKTVSAPGAKADPAVACVLAQLNQSGQLQAVSSSSLAAYLSGVLSAQGASVTILDAVSTPAVGGATFFVGYGSSGTAMINSGINQSAVTVPAARECRPQLPQTGWWWNPQEAGRGFSIEAQGNNLFMATYLYDVSGRSTWHVAVGPTSLNGSLFTNTLLSFGGGVTLGGSYRGNSRLADAGPITMTFDDGQHGTLVWPGGTVAIQRYGFGTNGTATEPLANQPQSGWWWGGNGDNGRGFFIEWQGNRAFIAGYMYDTAGNAAWYVADEPVTNAQSFQGTWLQFANGQTLTGPYRAPTLPPTSAGPVTIQFQGAESAILTLPSGPLSLSRFRF
ncbi:MAG: hypothetical protein OEX21_10055 [Betaproteobacteria bacterium]|nr:hypothetical protein [Betaproteobacteria bacterium]